MIGILDYGLGNVTAFANIFGRLGITAQLVRTPAEVDQADRLILPGVGAFDWAMARFSASGLRDAVERAVNVHRRPILGICVGMQMMLDASEEGSSLGLGWVAGRVTKFVTPTGAPQFTLPHMGWNDVVPSGEQQLFRGIETPRYYFLHSYRAVPSDRDHVIATADYYGSFAAAIRADNVLGTQFHPEKSHGWGIELLRNFATVERC